MTDYTELIVVAVMALCAVLLMNVMAPQLAVQEQAASIAEQAALIAKQEALIAKHELMPGMTRETAIDMIGTNWIRWKESGWVVVLENLGPRGRASLDSEMPPEMVISSWGEPDSTRKYNLLVYIYRQPPEGEIHVQFGVKKHAYAFDLDTVLYPEYFKRRFPTWTDEICTLIAAKGVALGMTPEMARASWGKPSDIYHSVNSGGVHDQWVYKSYGTHGHAKYLYFDNEKLTSWQD